MIVKCPMCQRDVPWNEQSVHRPFCSKKCQLIDLGEWAEAQRGIPAEQTADAEQNLPDVEDIESMLAQHGDDFFKH